MKNRTPWFLWFLALLVASVAIVVLALQNGRLRLANRELSRSIELHCQNLATTLEFAADEYAKYVEILQHVSLTPEHRQRAEMAFDQPMLGLGDGTQSGRASTSLALQSQFLFCSSLRDVAEQRRDETRRRFGDANQRFREADDREVIAGSVRRMAEVAQEVSRWPLRD